MKVYKNLLFAYSFESMVGFTTTILIIFFGSYALGFLAFFAVRPLVMETKEISAKDDYWFISYQLIKYSVFILSFSIIILYFLLIIIQDNEFLFRHRDRIIILFPFLVFVHGVLGLFSLKGNGFFENKF